MVSVNILWFLSLALGLLCALSATMVQQWARNYLQLVERRPAPNKRARIRAYLYEGIERFRMTAVVEAIPTLLHVSLFLFIIGLVIFLFPINLHIALIMLIILTAVGILYATVTFLPIRHKNCPYQTPLSPTCWKIAQRFNLLWYRFRNYRGEFPILGSLAEGRALVAMVPSPKQTQRDVAALDWVVESATDYSELARFFDAVPAFFRPSAGNADHVLGELGSRFDRSGPILQECLLQADIHSSTRRRRAVACMTALQAVAPKFRAIPMRMFTAFWSNTIEALRKDGDTTIATLAMCTTATLASSVLFHTAEYIPSKSTVSDNGAADEQLLMKISDQIPVDELAAPMMVQDDTSSKQSADAVGVALRILKSNDLIDAADRYLKCCRASAFPSIRVFFPTIPKFYDFEAEGLTRMLDWMNKGVIREAEISVQYLRNSDDNLDGWSNDRTVCAMSRMLRGLRTKKTPDEFWNCGRLMITNTLISQLMQRRHDTFECSAFITETLHQLIGPSVSPNDAYLETQKKFIWLVKEACSPSPDIPPLPFQAVEMLLKVFDEFDHPTSIALAINAIEGNQWLLQG
ncbi:hypothetical protein BD410DRAFT_206686 [Rickenella mellea]|uniref:DUF6535 domain-containing protein n=1 Tax=Rickenella mellea TaxID=50990 RepID=A0A4Y7Q4E7_9AGAM|nr:hypothetical protein BD410DRAFT_206686 [Rickenella mellea]